MLSNDSISVSDVIFEQYRFPDRFFSPFSSTTTLLLRCRSIWTESKISFPITGHESALFIEDEKIYFESWVEEGWNDKNDCATDSCKDSNQ